ncbi:HNH endonuclease [Nocardia cyriacigeorgica]|uniref:HNH endonuclease n=1 Tax=Nocardia cyriacigeorgica TaxID=135487 RepID=UPI0035B611FA
MLERDGYQCQLRWRDCLGSATEVDHRRNRANNGGDGMDNLQAVCSSCHAKKTHTESREAWKSNRRNLIHRDHKRKHPGLK